MSQDVSRELEKRNKTTAASLKEIGSAICGFVGCWICVHPPVSMSPCCLALCSLSGEGRGSGWVFQLDPVIKICHISFYYFLNNYFTNNKTHISGALQARSLCHFTLVHISSRLTRRGGIDAFHCFPFFFFFSFLVCIGYKLACSLSVFFPPLSNIRQRTVLRRILVSPLHGPDMPIRYSRRYQRKGGGGACLAFN